MTSSDSHWPSKPTAGPGRPPAANVTERSASEGETGSASKVPPTVSLRLIDESKPNEVFSETVDFFAGKLSAEGPVLDAEGDTAEPFRGGRRDEAASHLPRLSDYELISEIAHGGMGVVYRARQRSLNRIVALKMILAGQLASEADVQRFRSEAEAAANLQHPNIVAIYEVGETGGRHFFSMQFIDGKSLAQVIRDRAMSLRSAAECLRTVADAADYAHQRGILHRDLKPSNILVDAAGEPHLTDFGVAKRLFDRSDLTATGAIIGTPSYMPPEQALGDKEIDVRADIYSLGAVLYDLLTGRPPFTAQNPTETLMQVLNNEPVSPRLLNPSVPVDLSTICLKCLEKDPVRRYSSARALSADLCRWLEGVPIEARPVGRSERTWRWCKRNPVVAAMATLIVLIAISAFVGVTSQWLVAQSALQRMHEAQIQRAAAQVDALLKAAPESLTPMLNQLKPQYHDIASELHWLINKGNLSDHDHLRLSLALLPGDPKQVEYLRARVLSIGLPELLAVCDAMAPYRDQLQEGLWAVLDDLQENPDSRFSAALVLAHSEIDEKQLTEKWESHAPFLSAKLLDSISTDLSVYEPLVASLRPIRHVLMPSLAQKSGDQRQPQAVRAVATNILVRYAADRPADLATLLVHADPWQFSIIRPHLAKSMSDAIDVLTAIVDDTAIRASDTENEVAARRRATAAVALLQLGVQDRVWPMLIHSDNPRARSHLIDLLYLLKTDPSLLIARLNEESNVSAQRAILLALGNFQVNAIPDEQRRLIIDTCLHMHATDPDAGIHSSAEWALKRWGQTIVPLDVGLHPATRDSQPESQWSIGPEGHIFAVIDGTVHATMGSPPTEDRRSVAEQRHSMKIGRQYAIATKEVTIEQFRRFSQATGLKTPPFTRKHSPDESGPMVMITWFRAAQYCRWLSEQAGLPEEQMCYPPLEKITDGMRPLDDYLDRVGFRLPTEAEWEFSCRAGATTSRAFGSSDELLDSYAMYQANANDRTWPCGYLKPNDFGIFDMHGNVWEWCGDRWGSYWENPRKLDLADLSAVGAASNRVLRGGSFDSTAKVVRSAFRDRFEKPQFASDEIGFRVARTISSE
jgi:formylglycine-generating enzyme required for sulfatase activity/tRNA A-37 threonylcarbamoyl transferase component Bud32